jgi:hypothetical protein
MISPSKRMGHRIVNDESLIYWLFFSVSRLELSGSL